MRAASRSSTRPSPRAWAWAYLSAARSSKPTADGCGRSRANRRVHFSVYDPCHLSGRVVIESMSLFGTLETCQMHRAMSEFEGQSGKHMLTLMTCMVILLGCSGREPCATGYGIEIRSAFGSVASDRSRIANCYLKEIC